MRPFTPHGSAIRVAVFGVSFGSISSMSGSCVTTTGTGLVSVPLSLSGTVATPTDCGAVMFHDELPESIFAALPTG